MIHVEDRHPGNRPGIRVAGEGVDHVVGTDDQRHIGLLEGRVDPIHLH